MLYMNHTGRLCFFKQKTAYEMRISDWSSDVCSSDLVDQGLAHQPAGAVLDRRDVHVAECGRDRAGTAARIDGAELATRKRAEGGKGKEGAPDHATRFTSRSGTRSEERSGGKECGSTCRSRWSAYH